MRTTWRSALSAGTVVAVVQLTARGFPDLAGVPLAISLAKTDEARRLIEVGAHHASAYARPFVLPPGTSKERVRILRVAFQETLKDKAFLAEAEKANLMLDPVTGDEMETMVHELFTLDATLLAKLKTVLYN